MPARRSGESPLLIPLMTSAVFAVVLILILSYVARTPRGRVNVLQATALIFYVTVLLRSGKAQPSEAPPKQDYLHSNLQGNSHCFLWAGIIASICIFGS